MKILGLDFETQHDDAKTTPITEIGAVLVELDMAAKKIIRETRYGTLVYHPGYLLQDPFIVELTGITDEMLKAEGKEPRAALAELLPLVESADIVMAHNKSFDKTVLESVCARLKIPLPQKEWLCTYLDMPWPAKYTCKKLSHLAFDHGMKFDPTKLHRASDDVELMLRLVLGHYDIEQVLAYARTPVTHVRADIPAPWTDGGKGKAQAQKRGYGWERPKGKEEPFFPKAWVKAVKVNELEKERAEAPFPTIVLDAN